LNLIERLDQILPQTQCQRCGYPACRPYAEAMASGEASPNRCPPGGQQGVEDLAALLGQPTTPLELERGTPGVSFIVRIDPDYCIGCTKCIRACPVDAIIGANKRMHSIIADRCTGCELCIPPCPTDCITLVPRTQPKWSAGEASEARNRYLNRSARLLRDGFDAEPDDREDSEQETAILIGDSTVAIQSALQKALEQARLRLAARSPDSAEKLVKNPDEKPVSQKARHAND
jgi:Na+-translocating ferredoxin:NAD+ oxidoreductase subunit B